MDVAVDVASTTIVVANAAVDAIAAVVDLIVTVDAMAGGRETVIATDGTGMILRFLHSFCACGGDSNS